MSYGLVVGADVPGAVAERHGKSELLMPCDFMAVHHVMYDMHKSEVYHFPWQSAVTLTKADGFSRPQRRLYWLWRACFESINN